MLSRSPDPPTEPLSIPAKRSSRWTRPIWSCQTTERRLEAEPDPQRNAGKTRGSTRKRTVLPPQASPDRDDASSEQSSDGSLKVRRAKRFNRQHEKRRGDSPQLQHLESSRMEVKRRDRGGKDKNIEISELANVKSSTSSRKQKMHKASAHVLTEEDEEKWAEDELAALQEYVWFPVETAPVLSGRVGLKCVFVYPGQWRSTQNTRPITGQRWRGWWERVLQKSVTSSTLFREPPTRRSRKTRKGKRNGRKHQQAQVERSLVRLVLPCS